MPDMNSPTVIKMDRARRVSRVMAARRRLREVARPRQPRARGRIWLNGSELGDARAALTHLAESYD